ncbi:MAG: RNA polymerase sigma factor [Candidatus Riflebacteria bacterium]|nr:RNA polymerase sigma factor [Candidatus Riflebacteria bacterium]
MELPDKELIEKCLSENSDYFRFLVRRYEKPLFAYLLGRLKNRQQAVEAAQEAMVRAYMGLSNLKKPESFHSWLIGIGARVALELFRTNQRDSRNTNEIEGFAAERVGDVEDFRIDEVIAELPEIQRQMILLRYYESYSCLEVAELLQIPIGTVTKTLSRAYATLRQKLSVTSPELLEALS